MFNLPLPSLSISQRDLSQGGSGISWNLGELKAPLTTSLGVSPANPTAADAFFHDKSDIFAIDQYKNKHSLHNNHKSSAYGFPCFF